MLRNQHQAAALKAAGVDKVVCVTVGDPKAVQQWATTHGFDKAALVGDDDDVGDDGGCWFAICVPHNSVGGAGWCVGG